MPAIFRALRSRNYRLFYLGQGISLIGTWMQNVALGWLVYRLTNSPLALGTVAFFGQIPALVVAPFAGVVIDRVRVLRLLLTVQSLMLLQAGVLAILVLSGHVQVWHIICLSAVAGLVSAVEMPARQSFFVKMIDNRDDLGNAIALNSAMFNGARLVGPSIAGLVIAASGEGICFLINAASFVAVLAALASMRVSEERPDSRGNSHLASLREGLTYAAATPRIRAALLVVALLSLVGFPYVILMPVVARDILGHGPRLMGFLMAGIGMGAMCGALLLAALRSTDRLGRIIVGAGILFSLALIAFGLSRWVWLSLPLTLCTGFGMMLQMASCNTLIQTTVDDDKRGRVMSLYTLALMGLGPLGNLGAGASAHRMGTPLTIALMGACCLAGTIAIGRGLLSRQPITPGASQ